MIVVWLKGTKQVSLEGGKGNSLKLGKIPTVKSPSESTLYVPALRKAGSPDNRGVILRMQQRDNDRLVDGINRISLTPARLTPVNRSRSRTRSRSPETPKRRTTEEIAREEADEAVIEAERFKATATTLPRGKRVALNTRYDYNMDGEFLHVICHVDDVTLDKIRQGQFVELEKLLAKILTNQKQNTDSKVELINTQGQTFSLSTSTPDKDAKITNIKKWDKAFRVYAMVYSEANPTRSMEIMQYIDDIHSAAGTFVWDNVAMYDYMFRKLMAKHPNRSWGVTNTHMWTMYLKDHIPFRPQNQTVSAQGKRDWRDISCWRYNKNNCTKSATECRFEHRCSYCGSFSHIYPGCPKRNGGRNKHDGGKKNKKTEKPATAPAAAPPAAAAANDN